MTKKTPSKAKKSASKKSRAVKSSSDKWAYQEHHPFVVLLSATRVRQLAIAVYAIVGLIFAFGMLGSINALASSAEIHSLSEEAIHDNRSIQQFRELSRQITGFEQAQAASPIIQPSELEAELASIQVDLQTGHHKQARAAMGALRTRLAQLNRQLSFQRTLVAQQAPVATTSNLNVPILLYHNPPADFDSQLSFLTSHGYTAITMDALTLALSGRGGLPAKPVVITFDDGFSTQLNAAETLMRHNMPATFYIITGGERSKWCIGALRRYGDALQPPGGCGDSYMNWDQIVALDRGGLITIAGHTVDHSNLPTLSQDDQRFEIISNKQAMEAHLGHPILHFAYPYGSFNASSIDIVRAAGYISAVSTLPGSLHSSGTVYSLHRVREVYKLP